MQDITIWKKYYTLADEERNVEDIPIEHLHMSRFFMDRKKKDDDRYEPTTLTSFHRSLQGYLNDHVSTLLMSFKDREFGLSREALYARRRQLLRNFGNGNWFLSAFVWICFSISPMKILAKATAILVPMAVPYLFASSSVC